MKSFLKSARRFRMSNERTFFLGCVLAVQAILAVQVIAQSGQSSVPGKKDIYNLWSGTQGGSKVTWFYSPVPSKDDDLWMQMQMAENPNPKYYTTPNNSTFAIHDEDGDAGPHWELALVFTETALK